jgi:uncharacterized membrane protein
VNSVDNATELKAESLSEIIPTRRLRQLALILFGIQFLVMDILTGTLYRRMDRGIDFAIFSQAWTLIGRGDLNPYSSVAARPFIDGHFELIMWPLALLYLVIHSSYVLLVLQNAALAGTGAVTFFWILRLLERRGLRQLPALALALGSLGLLLINPVTYNASVLDFHFEAFGALFATVAAFDVWSGKVRRSWIWITLCLLCGDLGGLLLLGIGISFLVAAKRTRLTGAIFAFLGIVWIGLIAAIHANQGSSIGGYSYLAGLSTLPGGLHGGFIILGGVVSHPLRPGHLLWNRHETILGYLQSGGLIGFLTPWGIGVPLVIMLASSLQSNPIFLVLAFQNVAVVPFITFGSVWLLAVILTQASRRKMWQVFAVALASVSVVAAAIYAIQSMPIFGTDPLASQIPIPFSSAQGSAARSALAETPPIAEVLASNSIIGRFGQRRYLYLLPTLLPGQPNTYPINASSVVMVIDTLHDAAVVPPGELSVVTGQLIEKFHATIIVDRDHIIALRLHLPVHLHSLTLP